MAAVRLFADSWLRLSADHFRPTGLRPTSDARQENDRCRGECREWMWDKTAAETSKIHPRIQQILDLFQADFG